MLKKVENLYIIDKYGYIIDDVAELSDVDKYKYHDDFMGSHDFIVGITGCAYYFCNGYDTITCENPERYNCEVSQANGIGRCQCGLCE